MFRHPELLGYFSECTSLRPTQTINLWPGRRSAASLVKRLGAFCKNINPSASVAAARRPLRTAFECSQLAFQPFQAGSGLQLRDGAAFLPVPLRLRRFFIAISGR